MGKYLIDTHAHINMSDDENGMNSDSQIEEILSEMDRHGVEKVIIPSVDVMSLDRITDIANNHDNVYSMVGIFPSEAKTYSQEIEDKMIKLAKSKKVVAVGEIGLDYYWDKSFTDIQKEVFIKQIKMANKLKLPIVVHDRDAHQDTFDILSKYSNGNNVLFHCFSGSAEFMKECVKQGWYIAIGGVVTFKNAVKMKEVAKEVPLNKLVLETDSPYLTPIPFRGRPNRPAYVKYVAQEIADIRKMSFGEIVEITTTNAERFFNL